MAISTDPKDIGALKLINGITGENKEIVWKCRFIASLAAVSRLRALGVGLSTPQNLALYGPMKVVTCGNEKKFAFDPELKLHDTETEKVESPRKKETITSSTSLSVSEDSEDGGLFTWAFSAASQGMQYLTDTATQLANDTLTNTWRNASRQAPEEAANKYVELTNALAQDKVSDALNFQSQKQFNPSFCLFYQLLTTTVSLRAKQRLLNQLERESSDAIALKRVQSQITCHAAQQKLLQYFFDNYFESLNNTSTAEVIFATKLSDLDESITQVLELLKDLESNVTINGIFDKHKELGITLDTKEVQTLFLEKFKELFMHAPHPFTQDLYKKFPSLKPIPNETSEEKKLLDRLNGITLT